MKNKRSLTLCILSLLVSYIPLSSLAFSLDSSTPIAELVQMAETTRPKITKQYKDKFQNLAQMCRHAHNMRFPSQQVKTQRPTPQLSQTGVMTKHEALKREHQLENLPNQLMKSVRSLSFELAKLFPDKICHHQLFNFNPEVLIKQKLASEMAGLRELIQAGDFKECAEYIEQRAGL